MPINSLGRTPSLGISFSVHDEKLTICKGAAIGVDKSSRSLARSKRLLSATYKLRRAEIWKISSGTVVNALLDRSKASKLVSCENVPGSTVWILFSWRYKYFRLVYLRNEPTVRSRIRFSDRSIICRERGRERKNGLLEINIFVDL